MIEAAFRRLETKKHEEGIAAGTMDAACSPPLEMRPGGVSRVRLLEIGADSIRPDLAGWLKRLR